VPHHLLDLVPPTEEFSLSQYIDAAHKAIAEIRSRGKEVLFVGGTPLYLKSLLRGVQQGPPADWSFRAAIEEELKTLPLEVLHQRLQIIDPLLASRLHPNDKRRIIRGLEVYRLTGQRLSHLQMQFDEAPPAGKAKVFTLSWPRDELHRRIDARVEQMFAAGLVEEVRGLLAKYGALSRTAMQAVGYQEVIEWLERDEGSEVRGQRSVIRGQEVESQDGGPGTQYSVLRTRYVEETTTPLAPALPLSPALLPASLTACIDRVKARTRQFARRQETWFRSLSECTLVPMDSDQSPADVADRILAIAAESARV
jgi:tRNA dimethylallyltransferase